MTDKPRSSEEGATENEPRFTGLAVTLPHFEGPLDLLLHLVRSHDMDILDLPIVEVARQYNAYLDAMRDLDLDIAGEYLVMAATLALIKSRMLLPVEADEDGEGEDPRDELKNQLLEYERYKKAAEELATMESARDLVFTRPGPAPADLAGEVAIRADLNDLVRAFERILTRLEDADSVEVIRREDFRVQDKMALILDRLASDERVSFRGILSECRTRLERVVLFLGLLELIRLGSISVWQPAARGDIAIEAAADLEDGE